MAGFELALEDEGGEGELLFWEPPAPVTLHGTSSEGMSKALWDRGISKIFRSDYLTGRGKRLMTQTSCFRCGFHTPTHP
jgi:hypothetical protein